MEDKPNYYSVIPASVRYDNELKPNEKLLYGEITSLTNKNNECWAKNNYFASLYDVNTSTISRWISHLKEKGYITVEIVYKERTKEIEKLFIKLPRIIKVLLIYILVFNLGYNIYELLPKEKELEIKIEKIITESIPVEHIISEEKEEMCMFDSISCQISSKAKEMGFSEEQILISIAISKHETGRYTSYAFTELNNVGGMMCNSGLISYDSLESGIDAFLTNLKNNYFDIGLDTLEKIQPKYCPIGADNDPNGLNKYWLSGTQKMYNELNEK